MLARFRLLSTDHSTVAAHLNGGALLVAEVDDLNWMLPAHCLLVGNEEHRCVLPSLTRGRPQVLPGRSVE